MSRLEAWFLHAAHVLVGGTGLLYALVRYYLAPDDPFAAVHPWQPPVQHAHVWTAPLLVFGLGLLWRGHAWYFLRLGAPERRGSGLALLLAAAPMVVSGYLLQTAVAPAWRTAWIAVHLAASALWLAGYLAHQLGPHRPR